MPRIRVHEKALAHLSRGLYRSPASALRELVSNAWDANSTIVEINTNYPKFYQLSVQDNGDGFTKSEFSQLMQGGIGNSSKRPVKCSLEFGRPMIGRLGIGMLGIAQICGSFIVESKTEHGDGFRARVVLYDLAKERMDEEESELIHEVAEIDDNGEMPLKVVDVGEFEFEDFDPKKVSKGTRILSDDIHPTFIRAFQESLRQERFKEVPLDWKTAIVGVLNKELSLQFLGDYWRLLWELSASTPIKYVDASAVPKGMVKEEQKKLEHYNFRVFVDGRQLYKPVFLRGNKGGYTCERIGPVSKAVYGRPLSFDGYILVQEGAQLKPDELRGILIRIKNVGIGYYDHSLLDYRHNEGPRSRWVTGEIFIIEGLEDALNVDRDSFNQFHPEYRALQSRIHQILQKEVFPKVYKNIDKRSEARQQVRTEGRRENLTETIESTLNETITVVERDAELMEDRHGVSTAKKGRDGIQIFVPAAASIKTSKRSQQLAQSILAIFEVALLEKDKESQRRRFSELLLDLLKRW